MGGKIFAYMLVVLYSVAIFKLTRFSFKQNFVRTYELLFMLYICNYHHFYGCKLHFLIVSPSHHQTRFYRQNGR